MIIAERKPLDEIREMIGGCKKVLVLGCGTCVAICFAGGEKEAGILASELRMKAKLEGEELKVIEKTILRQCEWEFVDEVKELTDQVEAVVSLACGIGVQAIAERYPGVKVLPGVNTVFLGLPEKPGIWMERCSACGDCLLDITAGICPLTRCAKGLLNGPCGGSQDGKCEVSPEVPCAWQLIYDRLKARNQLSRLEEIKSPRDWSKKSTPGKIVREDLLLEEESQ